MPMRWTGPDDPDVGEQAAWLERLASLVSVVAGEAMSQVWSQRGWKPTPYYAEWQRAPRSCRLTWLLSRPAGAEDCAGRIAAVGLESRYGDL